MVNENAEVWENRLPINDVAKENQDKDVCPACWMWTCCKEQGDAVGCKEKHHVNKDDWRYDIFNAGFRD